MNYIFFFVHPSKFHVFRNTINHLIINGHHVEILITSKDVLERLVKHEGWRYTNIFPEGRKIRNVPSYISAGLNTFRTIYRLYKHTKGKKFDLIITDDLLVYIGKLKNIPSIVFIDDDLKIVKQFAIILSVSTHCLSPIITDLGRYDTKKIGFNSFKELAYLHPNQFKPDNTVLVNFELKSKRYFIIRLVSLSAYHDVGVSGLDNDMVLELIKILEKHGQVFITSERKLPKELEKYRIRIHPKEMIHILAFADIYIGDSQTMSSEAAILGVPSFCINDFAGKINVMVEKCERYQSMHCYKTSEFSQLLKQLKILLLSDYHLLYKSRKDKMISEKIDLTSFMIWLFENYPESVKKISKNPEYQYKFK
jgi:uncharacterized protein